MRQNNKVDRLIYLLSPHVLNPGTALTQKVKFLQEFFPKPFQTAHSGHRTPSTKEKAIIERYAAVMPSPMSLFCNSPCRVLLQRKLYTEVCTAWTKLVGSSLKQMDSTMIGHSAPFQVGLRFPSLLFYFCLFVAGKLLLGPVIFIFISLSALLQSFLNFNKLS